MVTIISITKPENRGRDFDPPSGVTFAKNSNILVADSVNGFIHTFSRKFQSGEYEYKGRKFGEKGKSPSGLSKGKNVNIIVADTEYTLIEMVTPEGYILRKIGQILLSKYFADSDTFDNAIKVFDQKGGERG